MSEVIKSYQIHSNRNPDNYVKVFVFDEIMILKVKDDNGVSVAEFDFTRSKNILSAWESLIIGLEKDLHDKKD